MRKLASLIVAGVALFSLSACGGSGFASGGSTTTTTTSTTSALAVSSSASTVQAGSTTAVTITAVATSSSGAVVSGATVTFSATSGSLSSSTATTNSSGVATTNLSVASLTAAGSSTVTATVGTVTGTTSVTVTAPGTGTSSTNSISVLTSLPQIASDGSQPATITALVRDSKNNLVSGATVGFAATSGGLAVTQATTDANGQAKATLTPANDPSDRTITVTASSGGQTATVPVSVVGTTLSVAGPTTLILGAQGTYSITLTNSAGNGIANQTVALKSASGNTLSASSVTTTSSGTATFTMTATNSGADTVAASGLGLSAQQAVSVSNQSFAFTSPAANTQVAIGQSQQVTLTWTSSGTPQANQTVAFTTTRGTLSAQQATTNAQGVAQVSISSTSAGPGTVTATATSVSAQLTVDFLAGAPATVDVQASPATIAPQGQSTITATLRDANDNLVQGQTVNFQLVQDATGGALSPGSATTNGQGQASVTYTATAASSATNGVVISATGGSITGQTSLTVAGQTVGLSLGTGGKISELSSTQNEMPWTVTAGNASSNGVANVPISFTVQSLSYLKGAYINPKGTTVWVYTPSITATTDTTDTDLVDFGGVLGCASEDVNNNGVLDKGEDYNGNLKLDPGLVATTDIATGTTDSTGSVTVNLIYPKDHAAWVVVRLIATATVNGTENSSSVDILLPALASDIPTSTASSPPGQLSPYGQASVCSSPL